MANDATKKTLEEQEQRRAQFTRIAAWTDPKPKPEPEQRRDEAEAS